MAGTFFFVAQKRVEHQESGLPILTGKISVCSPAGLIITEQIILVGFRRQDRNRSQTGRTIRVAEIGSNDFEATCCSVSLVVCIIPTSFFVFCGAGSGYRKAGFR